MSRLWTAQGALRSTWPPLARLAGLVLVLLLAAGAGLVSGGPTSAVDDPYKRQKENEAARKQLEKDLAHTDDKLRDAVLALEAVEGRIPAAQRELDEAVDVLAIATRKEADLADRLAVAEDQEEAILGEIAAGKEQSIAARETLGAMAREAYRGDAAPAASLALALGAASPEEFLDRLALVETAIRTQSTAVTSLEQANATNRNRQDRLIAIRDLISDLRDEAAENVRIADAARATAQKLRDELDALADEKRGIVSKLETLKTEQIKQDQLLEKEAAQIDADIKELVRKQEEERKRLEAERRRKEEEARKKANQTQSPKPTTTGAPPSRGVLGWPTDYVYVTSTYGARFHPVLGYWRMHNGTDIRAYCGTPIYAAAAGTVVSTQRLAGVGNQVLIDHGWINDTSYITSYNHLQSFAVSPGQKVSKGQVVAYSGNTGTSTACHLHFEVWVNGNRVDPQTVL